MSNTTLAHSNTNSVYPKIRELLIEARKNIVYTINTTMVQTYWEIGKVIVEEEQNGEERAEYGRQLLKTLSKQLQSDFGKGFDESNLRNIRQFYLTFPIRDALRHELTWTHYRLLLRVDNQNAREFYITESIENNWSTRSLERQINSFYYERILSSKDKKSLLIDSKEKPSHLEVKDVIKDPYVLEFLDLGDKAKPAEMELEQALTDKLQDFILELGRGFSFVARQKRISTDINHFYIDLVFYNYILKCFVLIELKTTKLTHGDIGQMDFYVRYFEKEVRTKDDNPTIGILLCTDKDETMIKYTLLEGNKSIFASKYKLYLPTEEELKTELEKEKTLLQLEEK